MQQQVEEQGKQIASIMKQNINQQINDFMKEMTEARKILTNVVEAQKNLANAHKEAQEFEQINRTIYSDQQL